MVSKGCFAAQRAERRFFFFATYIAVLERFARNTFVKMLARSFDYAALLNSRGNRLIYAGYR